MLYMIASSVKAHRWYLNQMGQMSEAHAVWLVAKMNHYLRMHGLDGPFYITPILDL